MFMIFDLISIYKARKDPEKRLELASKFAADRTVDQIGLPILIFQIVSAIIAVVSLILILGILFLAVNTTKFFVILAALPAAVIYLVIIMWKGIERGRAIVEDTYATLSQKGADVYQSQRAAFAAKKSTAKTDLDGEGKAKS